MIIRILASSDDIVKSQGLNTFGVFSGRLVSNVGANKQLAASAVSHQRGSNTVSIVPIRFPDLPPALVHMDSGVRVISHTTVKS